MKQIIKTLGLPEGTTEAEIVAVIEVGNTNLADAKQEIARLKAFKGGIPAGITVEELKKKLDAGLPRDKAIDVLLDQAAHDKTNPHDKARAADSKK